MNRGSVLVLFSVLVIVSPFLGLPIAWLKFLLPFLGAVIFVIGISQRRADTAPAVSTGPAE